MSNIDKQRVAAVRKLEELGYSCRDGEWVPPASSMGEAVTATIADSDTMIAASCGCARMRARISWRTVSLKALPSLTRAFDTNHAIALRLRPRTEHRLMREEETTNELDRYLKPYVNKKARPLT